MKETVLTQKTQQKNHTGLEWHEGEYMMTEWTGEKRLYKSVCEWNMNKPLSKNLQNIERNKTVKLVYVSAAEVEKKLLKYCIVIEIYRHK